jgi:prophage antirepressor-like protein
MKINMRTEIWNGHTIRFIEKSQDDWWAIAKDVALALSYRDAHNMTRIIDSEEQSTHKVSMENKSRKMSIISETGIYEAVFNSERSEAKEFKRWVKEMIKTLRKSSGLEGFQIFRMLDKEHQKETMSKLSRSLENPVRVDFIKANTIANKAVSSMNKHPKMLKKEQMTPDMLVQRQRILDDTVELMSLTSKFDIGISVSETIYNKYVH